MTARGEQPTPRVGTSRNDPVSRFRTALLRTEMLINLKATDRNGAIREILQALCTAGAILPEDTEPLARAVIARENQGSTGFGKGVATPHVRNERVTQIMVAIGRSEEGVDFAALDRAPVYVICLMLGPRFMGEEILWAHEEMYRCLQAERFRSRVLTCENIEELLSFMDVMWGR